MRIIYNESCKWKKKERLLLFFRDLTLLQERQQKKCEKLEGAVQEDEALFFQEMYTLMEQNKV